MPTTSITKRVKEAREIMEKLKALDKVNAALYWHKAALIYRLKNKWKFAYGDDGGTWGNFCVNELKMAKSSADQKSVAHAFFVVKHGFKIADLQQYDGYCLYHIAERAKDATKRDVEGLMEQSLNQSRKDFIADISGKDCGHEHVHVEQEKLQVCDACDKVVMKLEKRKKKKNG